MLLSQIKSLSGTNYEKLPSVIENYNNIADSIEAISPSDKADLDNYLLENIDENNDTLMIAVRLILYTPAETGKWLGTFLVNQAFDKSPISIEKRSENMMHKLNVARYLYTMSGEPSSQCEMDEAIDAHIDNLDINRKARLFTLVSTPEELARAVIADKKEKDKDLLIKSIRDSYAQEPENLRRFDTSLKK